MKKTTPFYFDEDHANSGDSPAVLIIDEPSREVAAHQSAPQQGQQGKPHKGGIPATPVFHAG